MAKAKTKSKRQFEPAGIVKRPREVEDPHETDAIYYDKAARDAFNPDKIAKIVVVENAMSRIGALCYIEQRSQVQEKAAELFKATYESLYGAQPAGDMSSPFVDRSPIAHDSGMASRVDRADRMRRALDMLGREAFNRVVASVCMGISFRHVHWRKRKEEVALLLASLDAIASIWRLADRDAA